MKGESSFQTIVFAEKTDQESILRLEMAIRTAFDISGVNSGAVDGENVVISCLLDRMGLEVWSESLKAFR